MVTSLKRFQMTTVDEIESNEEILIAIFVLLPPLSIFKFKCVSKRWNSILNDPYFHQSYSIRLKNQRLYGNGVGRLLAFGQDRAIKWDSSDIYFTSILPVNQPNEHNIKKLPVRFHSLEHYSDGLIICNDCHYRYCVVNPITKTWVRLPRPEFGQVDYLGLICEEDKEKLVPSFRVVGIATRYPLVEDRNMFIGTYSSKTAKWEKSILVGTGKLHVSRICNTFVYNGVLHWHICLREKHSLAVYDPNTSEKHVQLIKLPLHADYNFALTRSSNDDVLWVGMSDHRSISFWMLPKDENRSYKRKTTITQDEWIMMYTINNDYLSKEMALLIENPDDTVAELGSFLKLEALIQSYPIVAVLSMREKIFFHNLDTKLTELVKYSGLPLIGKSASGLHPFMESLFLSTYAPLARAYD